jgi:hypothetical protein
MIEEIEQGQQGFSPANMEESRLFWDNRAEGDLQCAIQRNSIDRKPGGYKEGVREPRCGAGTDELERIWQIHSSRDVQMGEGYQNSQHQGSRIEAIYYMN